MLPPNLRILRKFGREPLLGRDFMKLVEVNGIEFAFSKRAETGFYFYADDSHNIVLPARLNPAERAITGWHEFAHFLQNFHDPKPAAAFCGVKASAPGEKLAKVFANIATRPEWFGITGPMDFLNMIMRTKL